MFKINVCPQSNVYKYFLWSLCLIWVYGLFLSISTLKDMQRDISRWETWTMFPYGLNRSVWFVTKLNCSVLKYTNCFLCHSFIFSACHAAKLNCDVKVIQIYNSKYKTPNSIQIQNSKTVTVGSILYFYEICL